MLLIIFGLTQLSSLFLLLPLDGLNFQGLTVLGSNLKLEPYCSASIFSEIKVFSNNSELKAHRI